MRKFKRTYYKPVELTVTLTDAEEQEILEDLKEGASRKVTMILKMLYMM